MLRKELSQQRSQTRLQAAMHPQEERTFEQRRTEAQNVLRD
jgi:hypothetical protein